MPDKLFNSNFLLVFQGQFVSQIGTQVFTLAALYWVMQYTASSFYMGLFMLLSSLPWVLFAPLGGVFADRVSKQKILVFSDLFSGVAMLLCAWFFWTNTSQEHQLIALMLVAFLASAANAFFQPTVLALLPEIVSPSKRVQSNALIQGTEQGAKTLGFALGGVAYALLGAPLLFLLNGLSFVFSALSELFIKLPATQISQKLTLSHIKTDLIHGFQYVKQHNGLLAFFTMVLSFNFMYATFMVLLPMFLDKLGYSALDYGLLMAVYSLGQLAAFALAFHPFFNQRSGTCLQFALIICPISLFCLALTTKFWILASLLIIQGGAIGLVNVLLVSILQAAVPHDKRARVFGILKLLAGIALPFGMLVAGMVAANSLVVIQILFAASALFILSTVVGFRTLNKKYAAFFEQNNSSFKLGAAN